LVEIASQGEDVVITIDGKPKARLTRVVNAGTSRSFPASDMAAWVRELEQLRGKYANSNSGPSTDQILDIDRSDRFYYLVSGIDYTFGQKEGSHEDGIQADVG
jgi:antitoxin (DNA-binding transcriptional repressor) of toxin-antitoxin stability system